MKKPLLIVIILCLGLTSCKSQKLNLIAYNELSSYRVGDTIKLLDLSHKKLNEPPLINKDLLKFSSISFPSTNARIKGGIGKLYNLKKVASTAIPIIK